LFDNHLSQYQREDPQSVFFRERVFFGGFRDVVGIPLGRNYGTSIYFFFLKREIILSTNGLMNGAGKYDPNEYPMTRASMNQNMLRIL